jgi:hypothetical protein
MNGIDASVNFVGYPAYLRQGTSFVPLLKGDGSPEWRAGDELKKRQLSISNKRAILLVNSPHLVFQF